jgi:Zn-dependent protease
MQASWRIGRAFGVDVRVHWTTLIVPLAFYAGFTPWLPPADAAAWAAGWTLALYTVIWTHEMGHVWAARHLGVPTTAITLWPLGGLAHLASEKPNPRAEVFISLAGPLTHAFWFLAAGAPYLFLFEGTEAASSVAGTMLHSFTGLQVALLAFNLLPFWPMDGGAVTRAVLAMRMHPNRASMYAAYLGLAGAAVLGLAGLAAMLQAPDAQGLLSHCGWMTFGIAISNALACRTLLLQSRWSEGPYAPADEPWRESVPEAGWAPDEVPEPATARVERSDRAGERRERRVAAERKREVREADPRKRLQERIDALLDRINEVGGIENLTEAERRELDEASESLRRGR